MFAIITFWVCIALVLYPYAIYPLLVGIRAKIRSHPVRKQEGYLPAVTVVMAAYNEAGNIGRRIKEITGWFGRGLPQGELIVVSDGSTDGTADVARRYADASVRVIVLPSNMGKAVALDAGCAAARNEIIVFADTRQTWTADALPQMLNNFADYRVGAVSGDLVLQDDKGVMAGVGLYWRYEKWLRTREGRFHSTVGVTGAISAVRRRLFHTLPRGTILDDVYWPLRVAMDGYRVIHEPAAKAYDRLPGKARDEFRRKVRTLGANLQLLSKLPEVLLPWRNPIWFEYISHKLMRMMVPWALLILLACSVYLSEPIYRLALWAQIACYLLGMAGLVKGIARWFPPASAAGSFLILNAAAWMGFWVWILGRSGNSWKKISYTHLLPMRATHTQTHA